MYYKLNYFCICFSIASFATMCVLFVKLYSDDCNKNHNIINQKSLEKLYTAVSNIQTHYYGTINTDELIDNAIEIMINNLDKNSKLLSKNIIQIVDTDKDNISAEKSIPSVNKIFFKEFEQKSHLDISYIDKNNVLYIKIPIFYQGVTKKLYNLLKNYNTDYSLILDLRDNPGGILEEGLKLVKLFVSSEQVIHIKDKNSTVLYDSLPNKSDHIYVGPLVILINENSASTAELVVGALKKIQRALIMGQRSYGKASIQTVFSLGSSNYAMQLTTGEFTFADGSSIENIGIIPDIEISNASSPKIIDNQLNLAYEIIKKYKNNK